MKTFRYKCISADGVKTSGIIKSYDEFEAVSKLRESYNLVTSIEEVQDTDGERGAEKRLRIKEKELAMLCSQFSIILASGLPIVRCLEMIAAQSKDKATAKMLKRVAEDVDGGYSMAAAFEKTRRICRVPYSRRCGRENSPAHWKSVSNGCTSITINPQSSSKSSSAP